tara:strand:- start:248913 stop:250886 length:1974 start_codon:yes stop_codon:yes gene_type:complete
MFTVNALATGAEIYIYGDIGSDWAGESVSAKGLIEELNAIDSNTITIRINSVGGSVPDGLAIYNALKRHPAKIEVVIDGVAASIASLITAAGDTVSMAENAMFMVHAPWGVVSGNAFQLRESADTLDKWAGAMATSYSAKTGKGLAHAMALLDGQDHFFNPAEALAEGFIDHIIEPIAIAAWARIPLTAAARFIQPEKLSQTQREEFTMPAPAKPTQGTPATPLSADDQRRQEIETDFRPMLHRAGMDHLMAQCLLDKSVTAQAARDLLLAKLGEGVEPVGATFQTNQNVHFGESGADRFRADATAVILTRAGLADKETRLHAQKTNLRNYTLIDFAKASLDRAGISHAMMDPMKIVASGFTQSTSDFPILLENAMHKAMLNAYNTAPDTWSRFCRIGSVRDFRAHNRYRTGSIGNFMTVNELGEYKTIEIPDGEKATIQATTKGNIINLSRQMIINDDLGAFLNIAEDLGRAGRRTIEAAVYALLAENAWLGPTMADGDPLFDANHGNVGSSTTLAMASIDADRVLLGSQSDLSGNDFLYLRPDVLLVPLGLGGQARSINNAQYDPDTANKLQKPNIVNGLFSDIVDTPRLTGNRRYLFADPMQAPTIEVAFLNGEREPYIEQQMGFTVDGTMYKARLDFGVAAVDYRGAVTNAGG